MQNIKITGHKIRDPQLEYARSCLDEAREIESKLLGE